ncbi:transcription factor [Neophaeococcomyces mojaviensis]|uniref:Transcription factor n=1 Tax=Neophaeococcomyces mojaviensis TaxID=3383035 RepID=A0ACC3ADG4_9EURO|nr:transcription factor [Knufia sp. JES_112]
MPASKRKTARRKAEATAVENLNIDPFDSSPSARSSNKKRKVSLTRCTAAANVDVKQINIPRQARKERTPTPELIPHDEENDSDDDDGTLSSADLIESVISYLGTSKEPVAVATEHANEGAGTEKIEAFAKIAGKDWTYYVHEQVINIGRPPDDKQIPPPHLGVSSPVQDLKEQFPVHIDLGPSKIVSRHHASIYYDGDSPDGGGWFIRVNGRNGVRVDNHLLKRGAKTQLHSGAIVEIASTQMMFVMPNEKVQIDQWFIDRAKSLATGETIAGESDRDTEPERPKAENGIEDISGFPSLAPAPPNYKRTTTPPPSDGRNQRSVFDSKSTMSPMYGRGMLMESTQEIDYSRDSAKDLKPPYSYAHMIAQAIFSSEEEKLTLSNIYSFIADRYAFYRHSNSGWQNSIRHNLSLNKAFQKVPRRTDEPGKGMKWQIAPEYRQEYIKKMHRKGAGSSNPSSPAAAKDVNPNFRGPNGQNLGYDTSMVSSFSARDPGGPKMNMSFPPYPQIGGPHQMIAPPYSSQPPPQHVTSTPQRSRANTNNTLPEQNLDDSPLPQFPGARARQPGPFYTLPTSSGAPHHSPTNPTLSSSYLDTPFHPSQTSMVTPAPLRQNPRLAPPSTLVAPSKFMPESSPAGPGLFWKGFLGGVTPGPPGSALPPDMSPVKGEPFHRGQRNGLVDKDIMSSSPPPMDAALTGSPSKPSRGRASTMGAQSIKQEGGPDAEENRSTSTGPGQNGNNKLNGLGLAESNGNGRLGYVQGLGFSRPAIPVKEDSKEDEEDDDGGFDLAKGFAPIGASFSSQRSGGMKG